MCQNLVPVIKLYLERRIWQRVGDDSINFYRALFCHSYDLLRQDFRFAVYDRDCMLEMR